MTSGILLLVESRTDRFLLLLGFLLSLIVGSLLVTQSQDTEMLSKSPVIGTIKTLTGVNRRHARALSWSKIEKESKLYLKDMIYTPPQSSAEVILNSNEKLNLEPDSMVEFDSVSSARFNIVLLQGAAQLVSDKGTKSVLPKTDAVEVRMNEAQKPQLPVFFIDTKSWESSQKELLQSAYVALQPLKMLPESSLKALQLNLTSVLDYKVGLTPAKLISNSSDGPWFKLSWTALPIKGTNYEVEVSRNSQFNPSIKHETSQSTLEVQFLEEGSHYWRVTARNETDKNQSSVDSLIVPPFKKLPSEKGGE
ncbi:MAG: hypothetical protein ACKN9V_01770 [Pseudomonadota bacterium]